MSLSSENNKDTEKRSTNTYTMLQKKMLEVQKSKKPPTSSAKREVQSTFTNAKMDSKQSTEKKSSDAKKSTQPSNPNQPDRSYGDFFCRICDSHMNSDAMWEAHITGKRHIKNVKKGDTDSKYEDLDGVESDIKYELRNVKDPIIGLSYIHEIRRREPGVPPVYNCFLCHASIATIPLVIEHVISLKHRMNYMKENAMEEFELLEATNLKKGHLEPLVHDAAVRMEQNHGRGEIKVKQEKQKIQLPFFKKKMSDDEEDDWKPPKNTSEFKSDKWKPIGFAKDSYLKRDRSFSPESHSSRKRSTPPDDYAMSTFRRVLEFRNRARELSPRERELSPRDRSLSRIDNRSVRYLRERERSPRARERSPRARERSPRARERSPRVRERSPIARQRSPRPATRPTIDDHYRAPRNSSKTDNYSTKVDYSSSLNKTEHQPNPSYARTVSNQDEVQRTYSASNYSDIPRAVSSSYNAENTVLPHERPVRSTFDLSTTDSLKEFVENIFALSNDIFLKIIYKKLESMKLKNVEEMTLLSNIITKAQQLVCDILPSNLQAMLKQRMDTNSSNSPVSSIAPIESPPVSSARSEPNQNLQNLLLEIFRRPIGTNSIASVNQNATASQVAPSIHINPQMLSSDSFRNSLQNTQQPNAALPSNPPQAPQTNNFNYSAFNSSPTSNTAANAQNYAYQRPPSQTSNTAANAQNYAYQRPPSQTSNIPGLTLTEEPSQSNYNNYNRMNYTAASSSSYQNYGYKY